MKVHEFLNPIIGVAGLFALSLSLAGVQENIKITVKDDNGLNETLEFSNMPVGSTEVILTESGKEALVTRSEGGLSVEVDGQTVEVILPELHGSHGGASNIWISDEYGEDLELTEIEGVHVVHDVRKKVIVKDLHSDDADHAQIIEILTEQGIDVDHLEDLDGEAKKIIFIKKDGHGVSDINISKILDDVDVDIDVIADGEGNENHNVRVIKVIKDDKDSE